MFQRPTLGHALPLYKGTGHFNDDIQLTVSQSGSVVEAAVAVCRLSTLGLYE